MSFGNSVHGRAERQPVQAKNPQAIDQSSSAGAPEEKSLAASPIRYAKNLSFLHTHGNTVKMAFSSARLPLLNAAWGDEASVENTK